MTCVAVTSSYGKLFLFWTSFSLEKGILKLFATLIMHYIRYRGALHCPNCTYNTGLPFLEQQIWTMLHFSWAGPDIWLNNKQKKYRMQTLKSSNIGSVQTQHIYSSNCTYSMCIQTNSWLMVVIIHGSHRFLERFAQCRCSGNLGGGRKQQTKTKVGRKWLPGFRLNRMRTGLCLADEWWAIYFAGFLLMCRSTLTPLTSLRRMALSPLSLWRTVGDLYVLYVTSGTLDR